MQIGSFEHNLTTDLLNHLVFLQKVFMKEVNEVIQKVSGTVPKTNTHFFVDSFYTASLPHLKIERQCWGTCTKLYPFLCCCNGPVFLSDQ